MKIKLLIFILIFFLSFKVYSYENRIIIASTTSTYDTGLLKEININFTKKFNIKIHVLALGTGQAIRTAQDGNVEILIVHHKPSELKFMQQGFGIERHEIMYNDYIIVGPKNDLNGCESIKAKFESIKKRRDIFISRGDDSGTHKKELEIWQSINFVSNNFDDWYVINGQGMGKTLLMANEKNAYTISDRSTWISFNNKENLKIICENFPPLFNQYSIILVSNKINKKLNTVDAKKYIDWILSDDAKKIINNYKVNNQQLFYYNYN